MTPDEPTKIIIQRILRIQYIYEYFQTKKKSALYKDECTLPLQVFVVVELLS